MSTHKHIDRICCAALLLALLLTALFVNGESLGLKKTSTAMAYETGPLRHLQSPYHQYYHGRLGRIHRQLQKRGILRLHRGDRRRDLQKCGHPRQGQHLSQPGQPTTATATRSSLTTTTDALTYHGLDKLCLNNIIQDNTYMKDYLCYQMMQQVGVAAPLCSYAYLTVNGEDWGLYLAVEGCGGVLPAAQLRQRLRRAV